MIQATGEFSIEAWVAPALVAVDNSYMVSYSGGDTTRNFTLGQTNQDYDFMLRTSNTELNGMPQLQTPNAAMALQASLQHVVLTYDPVNGRQIYVNGVIGTGCRPAEGRHDLNWDNTFALVLGNEVSGDRSWQGLIKFVAIHSRAMTPAQVLQNFNAGVGSATTCCSMSQLTGVSAGLHHVHGQPVRQLQLPVLSADVHLAGSDRHRRAAAQYSVRASASASTAPPAGGPGLHPA